MHELTIWEPRYNNGVKAMLAVYKIGNFNRVTITKGSYKGIYKVMGATVKKYPKQSNGSILCYVVPMEELERID